MYYMAYNNPHKIFDYLFILISFCSFILCLKMDNSYYYIDNKELMIVKDSIYNEHSAKCIRKGLFSYEVLENSTLDIKDYINK